MRDLTRAREDAVKAQRAARQLLGAFLLRHGHRYPDKKSWTPAHMCWLSDITMPHPAQQITLQEYIHAITESTERVTRLTDQIQKLLPEWHMEPVVKALRIPASAGMTIYQVSAEIQRSQRMIRCFRNTLRNGSMV